MAALTRVLGIPSDHIFAAEHWRPLTRAEATALNPFYTSRLPADAHLYTCDRLGADGRCTAYEERPLVCRRYPWYDQPPRDMALADAECGYLVDLPVRRARGTAALRARVPTLRALDRRDARERPR